MNVRLNIAAITLHLPKRNLKFLSISFNLNLQVTDSFWNLSYLEFITSEGTLNTK